MTGRPKPNYLTPGEYLLFGRQAEYKNEYIDGEISAMTGASRRHDLIAVNITVNLGREISQQLKGRP